MARYRLARVCGVLSIAGATLLAPTAAQAAFCSDKANGWWCDGSNLVICQNGSQTSSENCSCGCKSMPPGEADKCESCGQ